MTVKNFSRYVANDIRTEAIRRGQSGYFDSLSGEVYRFVGGYISDFYLQIQPLNEDGSKVEIVFTDGLDVRTRVFDWYPTVEEYKDDLEWWLKVRERDELETIDWLWRSGSNVVGDSEYNHVKNLAVIRRDLDRYYEWANLDTKINGIDKDKFSFEYLIKYRPDLTLWDREIVSRYVELLGVLGDSGPEEVN